MASEDNWDDPVSRMSRDIRAGAATLGDAEARYLVDAYYLMQEDRKRAGGQQRALSESDEPHSIINWLFTQSSTLETQIKSALDVYTVNHLMGGWMREVHGIGPVISAGFLSNIHMGEWCRVCRGHTPDDCKRFQADKKRKLPKHGWEPTFSCPTVGHIWAFAGWAADGQMPWKEKEKRPFNAGLKTLCWKAGQSFMKFAADEKCFYGHVYRDRKVYEIRKNDLGDYSDQATARKDKVGKVTDAWPWYNACYPQGMGRLINDHARSSEGETADVQKRRAEFLRAHRLEPGEGQPMLPPGHIDARARRYAVKLFLAHLHGEWYQRVTGNPPPLPYPVAHMGHVHVIPSPVAPRS